MSSTPANGVTLSYRVGEIERIVRELHPEGLLGEVAMLRRELTVVKRLMAALILSVLGAALSLTLTLLATKGHA